MWSSFGFKVFTVIFMFSSLCCAEIYVSSNSTQNQNCGSVEIPCGSIQAGINTACQEEENTILVEPGTYNENLIINCSLTIK